MSKKKPPSFGSAIFCNSATQGERGKVDCRGIFTSFLAWSYPTFMRNWQAIVTIYDLPKKTIGVSVAIACGRGKKETLATADVEKREGELGNVLHIPLRYQFHKEGIYNIFFNIIGTVKMLKVPLKVSTQDWPEFTDREIESIRRKKNLPNAIRAVVICSDCSKPYTFEEALLPGHKIADGVEPFPNSGSIICESCGTKIYLKDVQGQVRSSMKTAVQRVRKGVE